MEDLLQSQIKDSCKLALPEGLRDLMSDISREVLRARPQDLYQFIADYLAALLVARETLTIAGHVCKGVCNCGCEPELDDELKNIGLNQAEVEEAKKIIIKYLENDKVKEEILMTKLIKTDVEKVKLPHIQNAVKAAYKRNLYRHNNSDGSSDDVTRAAKNTLEFYWKTGPADSKHTESNKEQSFHENGRKNYHQTEASSSNSSQCMFKNIIYDGGIKDLYVSSNCKPYKNSSLTSLAGSYGTPLIWNEQKSPKEQSIIPDNEQEPSKEYHKRSNRKQMHIDFVETTEQRFKNEVDEEIVVDNDEFDDGKCDNIDDEVLYADDESDISISEDIHEE